MQNYKDFLAEILIDEKALQARVKELGAEISADYPDGNLLLICILRFPNPYEETAMKSIICGDVMFRLRSTMNGTPPRKMQIRSRFPSG